MAYTWSAAALIVVLVHLFPLYAQQIVVTPNPHTYLTHIPAMGFNLEAPFAVYAVEREVFWKWTSEYFPLQVLRYPGGTISNFWDWTIGWGNQTLCKENQMPLTYYCDTKLSYPISAMKRILEYFPGSQAMWALNCETSYALSQAELLKSAVANGMEISFIELGNEFYNGFFDNQIRSIYPTPSAYSEAMNGWMKVIEETVPEAKHFALIGSVYIGGPAYLADWNAGVINSTSGGASALTLHWYLDALPYCGPACSSVAVYMMPSWFEYVWTKWGQILTDVIPPWPETFEIWWTEYNLFDYNTTSNLPGVLVGSWAHALLFAQQTFYIMSDYRTRTVMPHCLDPNLWAAFINISTSTHEAYEASPFGTVFGEIVQAGHNASSYVQLDFSPQIYISQTPALIGYQFFAGKNTSNVNIVNLSTETASIDIDQLRNGNLIIRCIIYGIDINDIFKQNIGESALSRTNCIESGSNIQLPSYTYLAVSIASLW